MQRKRVKSRRSACLQLSVVVSLQRVCAQRNANHVDHGHEAEEHEPLRTNEKQHKILEFARRRTHAVMPTDYLAKMLVFHSKRLADSLHLWLGNLTQCLENWYQRHSNESEYATMHTWVKR